MPKIYTTVGYAETIETAPGVWEESITDRKYYGDVLRNTRRLENGEGTNDNINISNSISIVADAYAYEHFFAIRYVEWMGSKWKVNNIEVNRPRLVLQIGGLYNGHET